MVPAFMLRQVDDRFLLRFSPPIYPGEAKNVETLQHLVIGVLEQAIGENPFQWFIFDDFWNPSSGAEPGRNTEQV